MKSMISEKGNLKRAFRDAYSAKEGEGHGNDWRLQVMRRIRQIGPLNAKADFWPAFERLVWRLVPVSCLLVLVLTAALVAIDLDHPNDYLGTVVADMEKPTLTELFGFEG
jgi:hypothetical protein